LHDPRQEYGLTALQTQLPPDYIELEKRVDALKKVHNTMLQVTYDSSPVLYLPWLPLTVLLAQVPVRE